MGLGSCAPDLGCGIGGGGKVWDYSYLGEILDFEFHQILLASMGKVPKECLCIANRKREIR